LATRKSAAVQARPGAQRRSLSWRRSGVRLFGRELSRPAYALLGALAVAVVLIGQLVEDARDSARLEMLPPAPDLARWAIVALVVYFVLAGYLLRHVWRNALRGLRGTVLITEDEFETYESKLRIPEARTDSVLVVGSLATVLLLFGLLNAELPITGAGGPTFLPSDLPAAVLVVAGYTVFGWACLRLVYTTVRSASVLRRLADEPLEINVFDTSNLVPFGNVALAVALAPAGIILILLAGLGTPSTLMGWTVVLLASLATVMALVVPLLGIHRRMADAKDAAAGELGMRLRQLHAEVNATPLSDGETMTRLRDAASAMIPLRATIQQMAAWPFRNTAAFGRAVLVASAPLIYATLNELIKIFWIQPLRP
jgi:hypothetical protein